MQTDLEKLVEHFPEGLGDYHKGWDIGSLLRNPCISFEFIRKHFEYFYNEFEIRKKYNTSFERIEELISCNPNIFETDFDHFSEFLDINQFCCSNPNVTFQFIIKNSHLLSDKTMKYIQEREIVTLDIIKENPNFQWDYHHLSYNDNITEEFIEENIDEPWNFEMLNVSNDFIKRHPTKNWDFEIINCNEKFEYMLENPQGFVLDNGVVIPWDYSLFLGNNVNMKPKYYLDYPNLEWNCYHYFMRNNIKHLNWEDIEPYLYLNFDMYDLLDICPIGYIKENIITIMKKAPGHPRITLDLIPEYLLEQFKTEPRDVIDTRCINIKKLYDNPNLTYEFITKHLDINWREWSYYGLSDNKFNKHERFKVFEKHID